MSAGRSRIALSAAAHGTAALAAALVATSLRETVSAAASTGSTAAWESMKSLQGDWKGTDGQKRPKHVSFRVVSNGSP